MTQTPADDRPAPGPLAGLRVLELGQLIAGPFTGTLLAYFGAEVIKIEPPEGDPIRQWRVVRDGTSLWWHSIGRNKKSVRIDLKTGEGRALVGQLAARCDVLVENFRPGTLEKWGLGPEVLKAANPGLVIARISGYGQDGPYAGKAGYASVCEGFGGLRYVNGMPGEPPVRPNLSIGDTLAALHAVIGILMALHQRGRSGSGQVVDVALFEAVYNLLESVVPEFDGAGVVREPSGTTVTGIVPTNTYRCADGRWAIIGGNGDSIYKRLMRAAGRADLADDPRLANNPGRVQHEAEIDAAIAAWTATLPLAEVVSSLETAGVPAGPIYSVRDMFA
ncbi:MAG TPA: CaiB/BaiF CoA-transferase family protein, partial [Plasticicumulans sp.]|nr:CaiB/BaiF CoA-transferase family protein [Plasticicumulans sp.]